MTLMSCLIIVAVPALKRKMVITQSDGTTMEVYPMGDENYHYYLSSDNKKYSMGDDGMLKEITEAAEAKSISLAATRVSTSNTRRASKMQRASANNTYTGKKKGLIILVQFSDKSFSMSNPKKEYTDFANKVGYTNNYGAVGSVHDYFLSQSYNNFDLTFDVIGPITLSNTYSYYGQNDSEGDDKYAGRMVVEACKAVLDSVTLSDYDWDGDKYVDQVFVLYAGEGEATGGVANTIWPHEYNLYSAAYYDESGDYFGLFNRSSTSHGNGSHFGGSTDHTTTTIYDYGVEQNGYIFDTYACSNELYNGSSYNLSSKFLMGIGTVCHEFSHCLGFPDTYDTSSSGSAYGMGYFDLMSAGNYNGANMLAECPAGYTAYERETAGWLSPKTPSDDEQVTLSPITDESTAYKLTNPGNSNEYFLLENRQQTGWDKYIPSNGLMVTHVDYDSSIWYYNRVNNTTDYYYDVNNTSDETKYYNDHQRMTILHADNKNGVRTYSNSIVDDEIDDLYPYTTSTSSNDSITDNSQPAFSLYNANSDGTYFLHSNVMDITKNSDGTVSFVYNPTALTSDLAGIGSVDSSDDEIISVYDLNGRRFDSSNDLNSLKAGVYIIRLKSGATKKIIIK